MNFFLVLNSRSIKNTALILVAAFFTAWILFIQNIFPLPAFSTKDGPKAIYKGDKDVAITFNIGWGDEKAEPIIDYLIKTNMKATTFFLSGSWAERHPDLVSKIVKAGFEIGMLGYAYEDYSELEAWQVKKDILKAKEVFEKLNIKNIELVRAPTGHFNEQTLKVTNELGLTLVHWSIDSKDWENPGVTEIVKRTEKAQKGDIILFHASDSAIQTEKALPAITEKLKQKQLKPVTVSEMIANGITKSQEIK